MKNTEEEKLFPCPCLPVSWPAFYDKAATRLHAHNKWDKVCSVPEDSSITKVVEHSSTACWDLQRMSFHEACSQHTEPQGMQSMCVCLCMWEARVGGKTSETAMVSVMAISAQESPHWRWSWGSCDNATCLTEKALLSQLKYLKSSHQFNKSSLLKVFWKREKLKQVSTC